MNKNFSTFSLSKELYTVMKIEEASKCIYKYILSHFVKLNYFSVSNLTIYTPSTATGCSTSTQLKATPHQQLQAIPHPQLGYSIHPQHKAIPHPQLATPHLLLPATPRLSHPHQGYSMFSQATPQLGQLGSTLAAWLLQLHIQSLTTPQRKLGYILLHIHSLAAQHS